MNFDIFDKDTMLDLTVNIVPLGILAFFIVGFVVVQPFSGGNLLKAGVAHALMLFTFLALVIVTYVAAVKIEGGEGEVEH